MVLSPVRAHKELLEGTEKAFVQTYSGELIGLDKFVSTCRPAYQTHIYSGSFNPIHDGHRAIYDKMPKYEVIRLFEMSIHRFDKPPVTAEEMQERLKQFVGYAPVMITNVSKFIEKAGICRPYTTPYFHVGMDTLTRILQHNTVLEVEGMACEFVFYGRIMDGATEMARPVVLPRNCSIGKPLTASEMSMSSTAVRNAIQTIEMKT